jgi:Oxidoreductase molybdopterin binding domain
MTTFNSSRRKLLERALALGAVSLLPGCNFLDDLKHRVADDFLRLMSSWNDKVRAALYNPHTLAPTFKPSQITRPPRFNAFYDISQVPLRHFLRAISADTRARYVAFRCADGYFTSIDRESALRPQTILALDFLGAPLTVPFGAPVRLRIPTKLGFKNPKSIIAMEVTNKWTGGYWANQGYNWVSGS